MRRSLLPFSLALLIVLGAPAIAAAGGFATVGLSSTPDGVAPGQPWKVDITVLQHGRTPLDGITPRVRISSGDATRDFAAKPTGKPGVYSADVVFPSAGRWDYEVLDGFIDELPHTFPTVEIAAAAAAAAPSPSPSIARDEAGAASGWLWGSGAALALALALVLLAGDRLRRRPVPAQRGAEPA